MKDIDYFFEWMSPSEVAEDFGISEKEALNQVKARNMRTQTTRHGEFQIFGEDLKAWYDELKQSSSISSSSSESSRSGKRKMLPVQPVTNNEPAEPEIHSWQTGDIPPDHPAWLRLEEDGTRWVTIRRSAEVLGLPEHRVRYMVRRNYLSNQTH